jgi:hypothetical protein
VSIFRPGFIALALIRGTRALARDLGRAVYAVVGDLDGRG